MSRKGSAALAAVLGLLWAGMPNLAEASHHRHRRHASQAQASQAQTSQAQRSQPGAHVGGDQRGTASVYSERFHGRQTADGTRFEPGSNTAASKTLQLGTTAKATNLETGKTATVQVRDRGPHRRGRIIDVSPGTAGALGMDRNGTAPVAVTPIAPPGGQGK